MTDDKHEAMAVIVLLAGYAAREFRQNPDKQEHWEGVINAFGVVTAVLAGWLGVSESTALDMISSLTNMMEEIHDAEPTS